MGPNCVMLTCSESGTQAFTMQTSYPVHRGACGTRSADRPLSPFDRNSRDTASMMSNLNLRNAPDLRFGDVNRCLCPTRRGHTVTCLAGNAAQSTREASLRKALQCIIFGKLRALSLPLSGRSGGRCTQLKRSALHGVRVLMWSTPMAGTKPCIWRCTHTSERQLCLVDTLCRSQKTKTPGGPSFAD